MTNRVSFYYPRAVWPGEDEVDVKLLAEFVFPEKDYGVVTIDYDRMRKSIMVDGDGLKYWSLLRCRFPGDGSKPLTISELDANAGVPTGRSKTMLRRMWVRLYRRRTDIVTRRTKRD